MLTLVRGRTLAGPGVLSDLTVDRPRGPRGLVVRWLLAAPETIALVCVAAALFLTGITWGLPNADNDWAIDSIAPLGPLAYAERMLYGGGWWSKYPPLHFGLLALAYTPYVAFLVLTGAFEPGVAQYPYGLGAPNVSLPVFTLMARTVSALMGVGTTLVVYGIARSLAGRVAGTIAGLAFAASPLTVYYAHTANLDIPYMFWSALALACVVRVVRGAPRRAYVLLGVFAAAAVATKDQAYGLFLLLPLPLLVPRVRARGLAALTDRDLAAGLAAAVGTYLVAANVLIDPHAWVQHVQFITTHGSQPYRMFEATWGGYASLVVETGRLIGAGSTLPIVGLAAIGMGVARARRVRGAGMLAFAAAAYLATFVGPILYILPRFVLPVVLVLAVFAGIGGAALWERGGSLARAIVGSAVLAALTAGASMDLGFLRDSRYAAEEWMEQNVPARAVVGLDGERTYLPRLPDRVVGVPVEMTPEGPAASRRLDFLVLSDAHYRRYLRTPELRGTIEALLAGTTSWEQAATFYAEHPRSTVLIPTLNPRIVILRRRGDGG